MHDSHYEGEVATVGTGATAVEIADCMDEHAVGCVVVTDDARSPVGIVTDRDLMRRVVAAGRDPEKTRATEIMSGDLATVSNEEPLERVLDRMRAAGVRRLPVVSHGRLVGIVALDDVVSELGRELGDLREALRSEVLGARRQAARRRRREQIDATLEDLRSQVVRLGGQSRDWIERELESVRRALRRGDD